MLMRPERWLALRPGPVQTAYGPCSLSVWPVGTLRLPSGRLGGCDAFSDSGYGVVVEVPPGEHPAYATVARFESTPGGIRVAYLSVVVRDGEAASIEAAIPLGGASPEGDWCVPVDSSTVALYDVGAVERLLSDPTDPFDLMIGEDLEEVWLELLRQDEPYGEHVANTELPNDPDGGNLVLSMSGWGDGCYPAWLTYDAGGGLLGVHLDFLVAELEGGEGHLRTQDRRVR